MHDRSGGRTRHPNLTEEVDCALETALDRLRRIPKFCAGLGRIEEHLLARHAHFGDARTRWAMSQRAGDRLGAKREAQGDRIRNFDPRRGKSGEYRKAPQDLLERDVLAAEYVFLPD